MNVFLSDPQRKKERSDAQANQKELYVAGLAKSVTEADLRKIFEPVCRFISFTIEMSDATSYSMVLLRA